MFSPLFSLSGFLPSTFFSSFSFLFFSISFLHTPRPPFLLPRHCTDSPSSTAHSCQRSFQTCSTIQANLKKPDQPFSHQYQPRLLCVLIHGRLTNELIKRKCGEKVSDFDQNSKNCVGTRRKGIQKRLQKIIICLLGNRLVRHIDRVR